MRNISVICYLFSLLSFGRGYLKMMVFENAITNHINTYDYTGDLSLAMSFFVLTIFFAVIGFAIYSVANNAKAQAMTRAESGNYETRHYVLEASIGSVNLSTCENNDKKIARCY
ncbi:conserved hypothetical protein [Candidatus Desulfosporosinus infrequens]|uniref:Uncharacterized protein n=1 Tax=Candidatus Desulfosporosinus infrequens TaxID=2043169 RepID=A0A2U3KG76_9FIRM|nr:conserved hypothetical protein [Candidatus Desulfosporosinus infrequens]